MVSGHSVDLNWNDESEHIAEQVRNVEEKRQFVYFVCDAYSDAVCESSTTAVRFRNDLTDGFFW